MLKKSKATGIICITLAITVLALGALIGVIWLFAPEMEDDTGYYTGGLNFDNSLSPVIYELTSEDTLGAVYLKNQSMGNFDGSKWDNSIPEYDELISSKYSAAYLTSFALENSGAEEYLLTIKPSTNTYVLPYYASTRTHSSHNTIQKSDIKNEGSTSAAYSVYIHKYVSAEGISHSKNQSTYETNYSRFVYENYLDVDTTTRKFLSGVIQKEGFSATDSDIISKITTYVRGLARYDLLYDTALDKEENTVISFMSGEYESGVCRHFASAATLLYRALGIPARYTTGYLTAVQANTPALVTAVNAHAWVEVYIDGIGWIQVEPTPPYSLPDKPEIPEIPVDSLALFKVASDTKETLLLKSKSFNTYMGNGWSEDYEYYNTFGNGLSAHYLTSKSIEDCRVDNSKRIEITPIADTYVLPYYTSTYRNDSHQIQSSDRVVKGAADGAYTVDYYNFPDTDVYLLGSEARSFESGYASHVKSIYLSMDGVPYYDRGYIQQLISQEKLEASDPDIIARVCNYLKSECILTQFTDPALDASDNYAMEFLTLYKAGNSKHFAAAATLIFRELGIPARFTMGYKVTVPAGKVAAVTADYTHYWVEIYKEGCGWVAIDIFDKYEITGEEEMEEVDIFELWASSDDTIYLKDDSFGNYNGQGFDNMFEYFYETYNGYPASFIPSFIAQHSGAKEDTVELRPLDSVYDMPYMLPYYPSPYTSEYQENDVRVDGPSRYNYMTAYYSFNGIPEIYDSYLREYESRYSDFVKQHYLEVDPVTRDYMLMFATQNGIETDSSTVITEVANAIKLAATYNLKYDRALDIEPNVAIAFLEGYKEGVCRHYAMAATLLYRSLGIPARYTTGYMADAKAGQWITVTNMDAHAWVEVYIDGFGWQMVEVTGGQGEIIPITKLDLSFENVDKQYDGSPLYPSYNFTGFETYEQMGYRLEIDLRGEQTTPGRSRLSIGNYRVYNELGEDVSSNFSLKLGEGGYMQVWIDTLTVSSNDISLVYDGYTYSGDIAGYLINGADYNRYIINNQYTSDTGEYHHFIITSTITPRDVCTISNKFDVKIYSDNGDDVTSYYKIVKKPGTFKIERRPITVRAASIDMDYFDYMMNYDEPFTFNEIEYDFSQLADGDYIAEWNVSGSISEPGSVDNILDAQSIIIRNSNGEDVTSNYLITTQNGKINMIL